MCLCVCLCVYVDVYMCAYVGVDVFSLYVVCMCIFECQRGRDAECAIDVMFDDLFQSLSRK